MIQDIIDLGSSADTNLQMGAFGPPVQEQVLKALADDLIKKREVAKAGYGKQPKETRLLNSEEMQSWLRLNLVVL